MASTATQPLGWGLLPLLALAVIITLTLQLNYQEDSSEKSQPPEYADYFIRGAKLSALSPTGKLMYQVQAEEILHFPDRSADLTDMRLHYQGGPAGIWMLKASKGRIPAGGGTVELIGDVVIKGKQPEKGLTQMRMSEVKLFPTEGLLRTDSAVSIIKPDAKITAVGMEADIVKDVISLSKDVQVRYAW